MLSGGPGLNVTTVMLTDETSEWHVCVFRRGRTRSFLGPTAVRKRDDALEHTAVIQIPRVAARTVAL